MLVYSEMSAGLLLVLSVTTEDAPLSPSLPPVKPSPPPPWPPLLPGTEMCDNGAPPGFVASRGAWGSLDCNGSASAGNSLWYHVLWSTCGATLCTAEIHAATAIALALAATALTATAIALAAAVASALARDRDVRQRRPSRLRGVEGGRELSGLQRPCLVRQLVLVP